ncbi:ATP-binding protein [Streptomyces flavalbus]|uniref:ATP-binding protein n=1 Tax=Streptomyces flavalbus TaxID=2665155 RepID=A0ABW2W858_9ACTN
MVTVSPSWKYTLHLPHDPRAPGIARATLRLILAAHEMPDLAPTAELVAAELLANSHCHTKGPYALRVRSTAPDRLRVAVWDTDPQVPPAFSDARTPTPPPDAENGRGIPLVQSCADTWGAATPHGLGTPEVGKLLWAECWR